MAWIYALWDRSSLKVRVWTGSTGMLPNGPFFLFAGGTLVVVVFSGPGHSWD